MGHIIQYTTGNKKAADSKYADKQTTIWQRARFIETAKCST